MTITTYPEMNQTIKDLLKDSEEFKDQYIYQRIIELEKTVEDQKYEIEELNRYSEQQKLQERYLLERLKKAEGQHESATTR
ncbi:hypothetical protein [Evansella clarkii]|uniref:hypothetical protein n=1 Tax=Evansella clarkii TaxID=79879 RepID=UPI0009969799|nr:hypothetical protein [Evansella clarkii]